MSETGTSVLLIDAAMRVALASTGTSAGVPGAFLVGSSVADAIGAPRDVVPQLESAIRRAQAGAGSELTLQLRGAVARAVRVLPVDGALAGAAVALVAIAEDRPEGTEIDELRARACDLEVLAKAAQALSRSTYAEEAQRTICEAAVDVAGADLAALIERRQVGADGSSLVVAASHGAELRGRTTPVDSAALAAEAFKGGSASFSTDLTDEAGAAGWPARGCGATAAIWQPVRAAIGIRGVIVVGWRRAVSAPSERLLSSLELLAGEAVVAIDRAAALEHLSGMARTDPLTELYNRRAWQDELARELARAERSGLPLSVGLIDLDELKAYNDRWGHAAGDRVLLTAAARWRRRLRLTDLLARIGGDEFAVTMPGCGLDEAIGLADQLRLALPDGLSCSVGVTEWTTGESASEVLARADEALYAAKNSGRDATFSLSPPVPAARGRSVPST